MVKLSVCARLCLCGCNMKDRTQQFEMSLLHVTVWTSKNKQTNKKQRHEAACPEIQVLCVQKHPAKHTQPLFPCPVATLLLVMDTTCSSHKQDD